MGTVSTAVTTSNVKTQISSKVGGGGGGLTLKAFTYKKRSFCMGCIGGWLSLTEYCNEPPVTKTQLQSTVILIGLSY